MAPKIFAAALSPAPTCSPVGQGFGPAAWLPPGVLKPRSAPRAAHALYLFLILAAAACPQTPGLRGRSANGHGPNQWPGYLGVGIADITPERAKALKLPASGPTTGVEVKLVDDNSPAAKAGLKVNDVILELNGQKVEHRLQFISAIGISAPGAKATLTIWREGSKRTLNATLEARAPRAFLQPGTEGFAVVPQPFEIIPMPNPMIGIDGETLTPQLAEYFGVQEGVLIRSVAPKTPAEKAGLKAGDVVVKVNGVPVDSIREISGAVRNGSNSFVFTVVRNHREITLNVELALEFEPWRAGPAPAGWSLALFPSR